MKIKGYGEVKEGSRVMHKQELLNEYEFYIWEILRELRAYEDWNADEVNIVLNLLEKITKIYTDTSEIEKLLAETFISLPELVLDFGKHDVIEGDKITRFGKEFAKYRDMIINLECRDFIKDKELSEKMSCLAADSIGENGFFKLLSEKNIYDNEKVENTFRILDDMVEIYKGKDFIDAYLVYILMSIYRIIFMEDYQDMPEISQNVSFRFSRLLKEILQ